MPEMERLFTKRTLPDVWRALNKIRATVFRVNLNLWKYFQELDPQKSSVVSEAAFVRVLIQLKGLIGLSDQEISELTDYFRLQDGRIQYAQFCGVVHNSVPDFSKNEPLVTGLEWEDPFHVNTLSVAEERRLQLLLTKIATIVNERRLVLRPYFQDYELISKNEGVVTFAHFGRILAHVNITVSDRDFQLLLKKFMKDNYTVNFVAFLEALGRIGAVLKKIGTLTVGGDYLARFPGQAISADLPKLPRPDIGSGSVESVFGPQQISHPIANPKLDQESLYNVIARIQNYVYTNRVRISDFFRDFDVTHSGRVTREQFRRCIDAIGVSGTHRLYLSEPDIQLVQTMYTDPNDPDRIMYTTFVDDIDHVFSPKRLELSPETAVITPTPEAANIENRGKFPWINATPDDINFCEEALMQLKQRIRTRGVNLRLSFQNYDHIHKGYVTPDQFRKVLSFNSLLPPREHLNALEQRYRDEYGINYYQFLKEIKTELPEEPLFDEFHERLLTANQPYKPDPQSRETDIVCVLAKVKAKVVKERLRIKDAMQDFDPLNHRVISVENFSRVMNMLGFGLTPTETATLTTVYKAFARPDSVDYHKFCAVVDESLTIDQLNRAPLISPLQHVPPNEANKYFLSYEERTKVRHVLDKLSAKEQLNLEELFKNFDRENIGSVSHEQFEKALACRNLRSLITQEELEVLCKCFGVERGLTDEVDYRAFDKALRVLYASNKKKPAY